MILVIDVGNTNIVFGVYRDRDLLSEWRLSTDARKTSDEYGMAFLGLLDDRDLDASDIEGVIISSVVPDVMYSLEHMLRKYFNRKAIIVKHGIKTGINIKYDNPKLLGADRIVNAVAAREECKRPLIIIDFGTATTYCAVTASGDHLGGTICPGLKITVEALAERAAMLPRIELEKPPRAIGKNTVSSIQSGLINGYVGQVEYIVEMTKAEMMDMGEEEPFVIATGGLSKLIARETTCIDKVDPILSLEGLRLLYLKNR